MVNVLRPARQSLQFVLWLCLLNSSFVKADEQQFTDLYDLVYQIRVISPQATSKSSIGSGFQVSADGVLITNYHVVSGFVQSPDTHKIEYHSNTGQSGSLELLHFDVVNDLASLKLSEPSTRFFALSETPMVKGQEVFALGNPRDYGVTLVPGPNNGMVEHSYNDQVLFSGSLNPGMSGGPAVNSSGDVVGVNVATAGAALSFLVPVEKARILLRKPGKLEKTQYQSEIAKQIKQWQRPRIDHLLSIDWPTESFAGHSLFGEIRNDFQCWGGTNETNQQRSIEAVDKSCRAANYVYLAGNLDTGQINFSFRKETSLKLLPSQFAARNTNKMWADNRSNFDNSTNYECKSDFVDKSQGAYTRLVTCVRAYKRLEDLFDSLLILEKISDSEALASHLSIAGAEQDQIVKLNRKFVAEALYDETPNNVAVNNVAVKEGASYE